MALKLNIPHICNLNTINEAVNKLPSQYLNEINLDSLNLSALNYTQVGLLICLFREAHDTKKDQAADFLKQAIKEFNAQGKTSESLNLENLLYAGFLKYCENENDYNRIFGAISECYPFIPQRFKLKGDGIGFFIHSPAFLAHVNPLFNLIKQDQGKSIPVEQVSIFTLGHNKKFVEGFNSLGVRVETVRVSQISELPFALAKLCTHHRIGRLVWQCLPNFLSYVSSHIDGIHWWSLKFHPNIHGPSSFITNSSFDGATEFNGRNWTKFTPPTLLKNEGVAPHPWADRTGNFGAFCREELIDDPSYWTLVSIVIKKFNMRFFYTGRQPIHEKYLLSSDIDPNKIKFLGWLEKPEDTMRQMSFILDGGIRGHGMMASEAIAGGVPVIWPETYQKSEHSRIKKIYADAASSFLNLDPDEFFSSRYSDDLSLVEKIEKHCINESDNTRLANFQKELMDHRNSGNMSDFLSLLDETTH